MKRFLTIIISLAVLTLGVDTHEANSSESPEIQCAQMTKDPRSAQTGFSGLELRSIKSSKAIRSCRTALSENSDSPWILYNLARAYESNDEIDNAIEYYEKAADQGVYLAYVSIGNIYRNGRVGDPDINTAIRYFRWAAEKGEPAGLTALGFLGMFGTTPHVTQGNAVSFFGDAARLGDPLAMTMLALSFQVGLGQEPDLALAQHWYEQAANAGIAPAYFALALLLTREGKKSDEEALQLVIKSAEGGYVKAQVYLAEAYFYGRYTEKNFTKAMFWAWKELCKNSSEIDRLSIILNRRRGLISAVDTVDGPPLFPRVRLCVFSQLIVQRGYSSFCCCNICDYVC